MLLLFSSGREDIKKPPEPICTPVHGTEGKPRCHPNCPGELPDHSMPRDKGRVPSAPRRELREWKGPRLHRFAPATGSLSRRRSRSSHHSSQPAMLKQNCRFNSINISLSAAKVKGFFRFCRKKSRSPASFPGTGFCSFRQTPVEKSVESVENFVPFHRKGRVPAGILPGENPSPHPCGKLPGAVPADGYAAGWASCCRRSGRDSCRTNTAPTTMGR